MEEQTKISIRIGNSVVDGILYDNEAERSFASMLPLTLTLSDYENTEKCGDLPEELTISEEICGLDPVQGDIAYYNPCGCLSIFFRDDGYSIRFDRDRKGDRKSRPHSCSGKHGSIFCHI